MRLWAPLRGVTFAPGYPGDLLVVGGLGCPGAWAEAEPWNPADSQAIAVASAVSGRRLGYLPRALAARVSAGGRDGRCWAVVGQRLRGGGWEAVRPGLEVALAEVRWAPDGEAGPGQGGEVEVGILAPGRFAAGSWSWPGMWREVLVEADGEMWCSCPAEAWRPGGRCRHREAVGAVLARLRHAAEGLGAGGP